MLSFVVKLNIAFAFFISNCETLLRALRDQDHGFLAAVDALSIGGSIIIGIALMFARIEWP